MTRPRVLHLVLPPSHITLQIQFTTINCQKSHITNNMTKSKPIWREKTQQPFENEAAVYTYIPRFTGNPAPGSTSPQKPAPIYSPSPLYYAHYYPSCPTHAFAQPHYQCRDTKFYFPGDYSHYVQPRVATAPMQYLYQPQSSYFCDVRQPVYHQYPPQQGCRTLAESPAQAKYNGKPLKGGTLP